MGDKGDAVKTMQTMLIKLGYSCGKYGADGDFGSGSLASVKAFQHDNGLVADGLYGEATKAKLTTLYTVSYTHLDVYKRQSSIRRLCMG